MINQKVTVYNSFLRIVLLPVLIIPFSNLSAQSVYENYAYKSYEFSFDNVDSCFHYAELLLEKATEEKEEYWIQKSKYYNGVCLRVNGQLEESQKELSEFLDYAIKTEHVEDQAYAKFELSQDNSSNQNPATSISLLNEAIAGFTQIENNRMLGKSLVNKCVLLRRQRQFESSEEVGLEALDLFESTSDSSGMAEVYNALGVLEGYQGNMKAAADYFLKQTVINEKLNDLNGLGHSLGNLGFAHLRMNQIDEGEKYIGRAVEIRRKQGIPYELAMSLIQIAEVNVLKEDYRQALKYSQESLEIAVQKNLSSVREGAYRQLSYIHENLGNTTKALGLYKNYEKLKDSLRNIKVNETAQKVEAVYQNAEKEKEIITLQAQDDLNAVRLKQQQLALGAALLGIGLLAAFFYSLFRQKKKIELQNSIISTALSEKETLLKEIHHRVKNNLQVISSLLRIQSHQTDDEVAVDALKDSQSRVQSMSLIHQDLYQHDNLTGINMKEYLERLTRGLFNTYNISEERMKLVTDIDEIELDVDTVVPLGLIINELVTNALKYAFPDKREGNIHVTLRKADSDLIMTVKDDGIGMKDIADTSTFGQGLIRAFANKLESEINIKSDNGTTVEMVMRGYAKW